jgi:hypothetical protein
MLVSIADPPANTRRLAAMVDSNPTAAVSNEVFDEVRDEPRLFEHHGARRHWSTAQVGHWDCRW